MALGMTYEQYWYGDPLMARAFYKADKLRQERMNDEAWLYGIYTFRAFQSALSVSDLFRPKGQNTATQYPRKPVSINDEEETEEDKQAREAQEAVYAEAYMSNMILAGKSWGKEVRQ